MRKEIVVMGITILFVGFVLPLFLAWYNWFFGFMHFGNLFLMFFLYYGMWFVIVGIVVSVVGGILTPKKKEEVEFVTPVKDFVQCPECGSQISTQDEFCPHCGAKLE